MIRHRIASMLQPVLLSAREEAALIRRHESAVSRARRDPQHPAYRRPDGTFTDPRTTGNAYMRFAPRDAVEAYWEPRLRATRGPRPTIPAGLTRTGWTALQALADHGTPPSQVTRSRLTSSGWLDDTGAPTAAAQAALTARTPREDPDA